MFFESVTNHKTSERRFKVLTALETILLQYLRRVVMVCKINLWKYSIIFEFFHNTCKTFYQICRIQNQICQKPGGNDLSPKRRQSNIFISGDDHAVDFDYLPISD